MPLPLLAAVAAPAATLWNYNRANFLYDSGQKVTRTYTSISYQMQQFQLYRQDVRDLVALTAEKMNNYHVVACLELGMTATLLGPARLPDDVPEWVLWHQLISLCAAFVFLVTSMWLATRAAVAAGSFNVRLQTQYIRLPLPDDEQLDSALTKAEEYEGVDMLGVLRLPFLAGVWNRFWGKKMAGEGDGLVDIPEAAVHAPPPEAAAVDAQGPGHLQLYQHLQRKWSCYDAYARITMSMGTFWLILSLCYYEIGWNLCHLHRGFPAVVAAIMLAAVVVLLVYLDIFVSRVELAGAGLLIFAGPTLVAIGASLHADDVNLTPCYAFVADAAQVLLSMWFWHLGHIVQGKDTLPTRWKGVAYLDIFGPIVKELKSLLDKTGLGHNAHTDDDCLEGNFSDLFDFVDKDSSGEITREEWDAAFDAIDSNRSGTITRQEWRQHHGQAAIFDVVDGNGNGAVSRAEWRAAFAAFDRNGDGTISCSEWYRDGQRSRSAKGVGIGEVRVSVDPQTDAARVANARARLQSAIDMSGSTRKQKRMLNMSMRVAALVGLRGDDPLIKDAEGVLASFEVPREMRKVRQIVRDWREGEVYRHLDRQRRVELDDLARRVEEAATQLGMPERGSLVLPAGSVRTVALKPKQVPAGCVPIGKFGNAASNPQELPAIMRTLSVASSASATSADFVPVWTRVSHNPMDGSGAHEYWCGTATTEGRWGFSDDVPSDARAEEYSAVKARCVAVLERAEQLLERRACWRRRDGAAPGQPALQRQGSMASVGGSFLLDDEDIDSNDPNETYTSSKTGKLRTGHHPIVAFRAMSLAMITVWSIGLGIHIFRWVQDGFQEQRRLASSPLAFDVDADAGPRGALRGSAAPKAAVFEWAEGFFSPRSVRCFPGSATDGAAHPGVVASNGFLVYGLPPGAESTQARRIECPVEEHDGLVAAGCSADGHCTAVVATKEGLWRCGARSSEGGSGAARPVVAASGAYVRGRAPLRVWAATDAKLATVFAAPAEGPIVEFRRTSSGLQPVAELSAPASVGMSPQWLSLEVTSDGILVAVAEAVPAGAPSGAPRGPMAFAWSLATGRHLGIWPLPVAAPAGDWLGWCMAEDQALYGLAPANTDETAAGGSVELRRVVLPPA